MIIVKLRNILNIVNTAQGAVFTKLHFLFKLKNEPNKLELHYTGLERLATDKQSSLLDLSISYEENEV